MDYDTAPTTNSSASAHFPLALIGLAFCVFFLAQILDAGVEADGLANQQKSIANFTLDVDKQLALKKEDQEERQKAAATAKKMQEESDEVKKEVKDIEQAQKASFRFAQLNKQMGELDKALKDSTEQLKQAEKLELQAIEFMQGIDKLAQEKDADAQVIAELAVRSGINVTKPAGDAKATDSKDEKKDK